MLSMNEIRAKNYKIFPNDLAPDFRQRQESSLKYIEHLGSLTNTNISEWTPVEIFGDEKGQLPVVRNKINEIFFSYVERTRAQKKDEEPQTLTAKEAEAICYKFDQVFAKVIDKTIEKQKKQIISCENDIQSYSQEVRNRQERLFKEKAILWGLDDKKKKGTGVADDLNKILSEGWWTVSDSPKENHISLVTPHLRISQMKEKAAVSTIANLGRIQLNIGTSGSTLTASVSKYDENPMVGENGYFHPHAEPSGHICFGQIGGAFNTASQSFNLLECCEIVKKVLTSYYDGSPYVQLHKFEEAAQRGDIFLRANALKKSEELRQLFAEARVTAPLSPSDVARAQAQVNESAPIIDEEIFDDEDSDESDETGEEDISF